MKKLFRENGLSIVLFVLFLAFWLAQSITGFHFYNSERKQHGQSEVAYSEYLRSGDFLEVTMENWESEFLQMFMFVLLTTFLYQKGSAESNPLDSGQGPPKSSRADSPWPVKRGGIAKRIYRYSLSLVFLILFTISIVLHAVGGAKAYSEEEIAHGRPPLTTLEYVRTSRFWFESFQNWQSEFLAIFAMVVLTIFLRQDGSPESKPVESPHSETGK